MSPAPGRNVLRASDADRESTAALLRRGHAEGRLDTAELEERMERCYASRTLAELDGLVHDLAPPRAPARPRGRPGLLVLVPIAVALLVAAAATHGRGFVLWPLLFFVYFRFVRGRFGLTPRRRLR